MSGPRHGAEDGAGQRAYEAYADLDPVGPPPPQRRRFIDYPRGRRRGWTRWIPSWRFVLSLFLLATASLCAAVLIAYSRTAIPSQQNLDASFQTTIVFDAHHNEIGRFAAQNRIYMSIDKIPKRVQDAVIAAEDRSFHDNNGVSFTGVVRAAINNARGGAKQGGSTITQQFVKNAYFSTTDRSLGRKLNEFFISIKAAQELSKDKILERYLNIIYFGRGCYGIEAAAHCYFDKGVGDLSVSEAAYLAGIINGPELYDSPSRAARAAAEARRQYVLDGMVTMGTISPQERAAAKPPKVRPRDRKVKSAAGNQTQYLLDMVRAEALRYGIDEQKLQRGGYRITTTFNPDKMGDAQASVTKVLGPIASWPKGTVVGIVTVDASNGQVVSVYAGDGKRQNAVTQDIAQAGSTFKPFALVAALEGKREPGNCDPQPPGPDSLSLRSRVDGHSPQKFDGLPQPVSNDEGDRQMGYIDLVTATAQSVNTAYVGLNKMIGPEHTKDVAICAGLPGPHKSGRGGTFGLTAGLNNVLGTGSPHPIDMARAYATLAAGGVRHDTHVIASLTKADGSEVAVTPKDDGKRVFEAGVVADATYAMQAVVKQGTGTYVRNLGRPVAGKTGTTEKNKAAWFAGFTPHYATVVVMQKLDRKGNPVSLVPFAGVSGAVYGGTLPAKVWTEYMKAFLGDSAVQDFPPPTYGGTTVNPSPAPSVTPSAPAPTPSGTPTTTPTATATPTPTASEPSPSPTTTSPNPSPSPSEPPPTVKPSPPGFPKPKPKPSPSP